MHGLWFFVPQLSGGGSEWIRKTLYDGAEG